jgi:hypothetical protein
MNYDAVIKSVSLQEDFPEKIKVDDDTTLIIEDKKIIINEFDREKDPLSSLTFDKGFTVGLKVTVSTRHCEKSEKGFSVTTKPEMYGEFMYLKHDATLKDVMTAIDELVRSTRNQIVGKPSEA